MKLKITQPMLCLGLFLVSTSLFAQIVVSSVFPRRVTTKTEVTITGGTSFTNATNVILSEIDFGSKTASNGGTQLTFEITRTNTSATGDVAPTPLMIGSQLVYTGFFSPDNQVFIEYIGPTDRTLQASGGTNPVTRITEVFTNWDYNGNGYYKSSWYSSGTTSTWPNDRHDLLAYTYNGTTYSTGVDDQLLTDKGIPFTPQTFKAYSTNGIKGNPHGANFLAMADKIDGVLGSRILNDLVKATVYDVIIDGSNDNGLDLGTGITNFNRNANIRFFSGNAIVGALGDAIPDLLLTQIAQAGGSDIYYYADIEGNVVGRPINLSIPEESNTILYKWFLDLYRMDLSLPYDQSLPNQLSFGNNENRPFRMIALELDEFEIVATPITSPNYIGKINNINMQAGGTADLAFMAYNRAAFDIKSPKVDQFPVSRNVCKVPNTDGITFNAAASIDGGGTGASGETLQYQWYKNFAAITGATSDSYNLAAINGGSLGTYKVRIFNDFGAVDLPVTLAEGGTPTFWDGANWVLPAALTAAGVNVSDADRNLIFSEDYSENSNLEGCDCRVVAGRTVTIPMGQTLKLYNTITVEPEILAVPLVNPYIPAGQFTLANNASLIQTKDLSLIGNENSGSIRVQRLADNLHVNDYVYWSSPVAGFNINGIPGSSAYEWDPTVGNPEGSSGNWVSASGLIMAAGKGYIKKVTPAAGTATAFTNTFSGIPNNGPVTAVVRMSNGTLPAADDQHWNLIGNPYPSAINAVKFLNLTENNSIEGAIYLWTHHAAISSIPNPADSPFYQDFVYNYGDQYLTFNELGETPSAPTGETFNGNIAAGQGFFVRAVSDGNVTFKNELRHDTNEDSYDNTNFFRTDSEHNTADNTEKQLIWLSLVADNAVAVSTLLGYAENATYARDRMFDAQTNSDDFSIYSMIANDKMSIQGRPLPFETSDTVPLGIEIPQNGIYKIGIDNLQGSVFVDQAQAIYLEDTYLNLVHDLRATPYGFTAVTGAVNDRFVLRYTQDETLAVNESIASETFAFIKNNELQVRSSQNIESIQIYDLNGKQIATYELKGNNSAFNANFQFARGVYLAVITLDTDLLVKKKLIN